MKMKTYVAIILDQSGSMCGTKAQAVQGYNEQVQQMKLNSKDQDIFCSLVTFNGSVYEHLWCEPAEKLTEAAVGDYNTEGSTAMRDAVGYTIEKLKKTTNDKDNVAYLVVIISDGEENSSQNYSLESLREIKESVDKTGKWTFTYMGCDEKYLRKVAKEMNIPISNVAKWSNATEKLAKVGMHHNAKKMRAYYSSRASGQICNNNVYNDDASCIADFTVNDSELDRPSPDGYINMNVLNDGHKTVDISRMPFSNNAPVDWRSFCPSPPVV